MLALEFGRMLLALALVLGLLWACSRVGRGRNKRGLGRSVPGIDTGRIEVMDRRSLGRHSSIAVVRAAGKIMVVGQTPQQISVLMEAERNVDPGTGAAIEPVNGTTAAGATVMGTDQNMSMPGLASSTGVDTPKAWDAFVERLREMTVRH